MSDFTNWPAPEPTHQNINPIASEPRAGFWIRFVANFCDSINSSLVAFVISLPFTLIVNGEGSKDLETLVQSVTTFILLAHWIGTKGGSPLRRKLGVIVLDENDGSFIGFRRGAIRIAMSWVSALVFLVGYLWMLWDKNSQTWHDKVAHTVVVRR